MAAVVNREVLFLNNIMGVKMPRVDPEELWQKHLLECYMAFTLSEEFSSLRTEGLAILKQKTLLTVSKWWSFSD